MWRGAGLAGAEFALLSGLGATSWTTNCQRLFFFGFRSHNAPLPGNGLVNFDQSASPLSLNTDKKQISIQIQTK